MQHPELLKWFKDFVGFRDGSSGPGGAPPDSVLPPADGARVRQERSGDAAMEIGEYTCPGTMCWTRSNIGLKTRARLKFAEIRVFHVFYN